jgi:hypothetical protein
VPLEVDAPTTEPLNPASPATVPLLVLTPVTVPLKSDPPFVPVAVPVLATKLVVCFR